jgi:hypothetical protein
MTRRLLLISFHFGPDCETGGFRWNAIAAYLARSGWEVDVISAARPGATTPYEPLPGVRVTPVDVPNWMGDLVERVSKWKNRLKQLNATSGASGETTQPALATLATENGMEAKPPFHSRFYDRMMANISAAARWSAQTGWARRAANAGLMLARTRMPSVVAVSSPPHPTHLAGVRLARVLGLPYLADLRDPWLFGELDDVQSALTDRVLGAAAQRKAFNTATRIILNTDWAARAAREHESSLTERIGMVPNGYDSRPEIGRPDPEIFRVAFVGWLYDFMNPEPVLAACGRFALHQRLENFRVEFVGMSPAPAGVSLISLAQAHGLERYFEYRRRVSRADALRVQERAALQVVFDYPGPLRVPMKFYDGVQMYGDLLLIGRPQSALGEAAARVGLSVCHPDDSVSIDAAIMRAFERWRAHDYSAPIDSAGIFARELTSRKMLDQLEGVRKGEVRETHEGFSASRR